MNSTSHTISDQQFLLGADLKTFYRITDADAKGGATPGQAEALRSPAVVERWYSTLRLMKMKVEGTLAAKEADATVALVEAQSKGDEAAGLEAARGYQTWRARALRFRSGIEEKLWEAESLRETYRLEHISKDAGPCPANQQLRTVLDAIEAHRRGATSSDDSVMDEADDVLWAVLEDATLTQRSNHRECTRTRTRSR